MLKFPSLAIGTFLLLILLPGIVSADLYEDIFESVSKELMYDEAEKPVVDFIRKAYEVEPQLTADEINTIVSQEEINEEVRSVCVQRELDFQTCNTFVKKIRAIANRESRVRTLGRDLQAIAGGYELPLTDFPSKMMSIVPRMPSIIRMWQSSQDWMVTPIVEKRVRAENYPDGVDSYFDAIQSALSSLDGSDPHSPELLTAAVASYKYGWRQFDSGCTTTTGNSTEMQFKGGRWCDVETALQDLTNFVISGVTYDPPLQPGEIVLFPTWLFRDMGVTVWVHSNFYSGMSDAGLEWEFPIYPILPSLRCSDSGVPGCEDGVILGGLYPPYPPAPSALCGSAHSQLPFSPEGYLCRPLDDKPCQGEPFEETESASATPSPGEEEEKEYVIELAQCKTEHTQFNSLRTVSGPDACQIGGWRFDEPTITVVEADQEIKKEVIDTPEIDDETDPPINQPFDCSNCAVDLFCAGNGNEGEQEDCDEGYEKFSVLTPKNDDKVIYVCIPNTPEGCCQPPSDDDDDDDDSYCCGIPEGYLVLQGLIRAQQYCNLPGEMHLDQDLEACCAFEYPPAFAMCNAFANDKIIPEDGINRCTGIIIDAICGLKEDDGGKDLGGMCTLGFPEGDDPEAMLEAWQDAAKASLKGLSAMVGYGNQNNLDNYGAGVSQQCGSAIDNMDVRSAMVRNSLPLVCTPECTARYPNTIGNNACYTAQCVEQSLETQRILPGRFTFVTSGQSFAWDARAREDPMIGAFLPTPPLPQTSFPSYKPELLAKELDLALCQVNANPLKQPPRECAFNDLRKLQLRTSQQDAVSAAELESQTAQNYGETTAIETIAPGIGTRIGTQLFREYFDKSGMAFWELIRSANILIGGLGNIRFPLEMCPRYNG